MKKVKGSRMRWSRQKAPTTKSKKDILYGLLCLGAFFLIFVFGLLYMGRGTAEKWKRELSIINANNKFGKGIITNMKSYKGHSIDITYKVGGKTYSKSSSWDTNPHGLRVGDSIYLRYAVDSPSLMVHVLQRDY
ncbi:hypothetical protein [Chitinophaga sp. Cy-1792]|uniref:hypothetical protein n=1 Tax=Chitinophaga sp. Cy-1792 TaxID=2608339 RepID=UPI00141EAD7C|nr:hypothetical protein [Chitinophaga sp. Cy-1792]NIG53529.1 hypothetical protein [Chitinophaga sp. Cy-1792]